MSDEGNKSNPGANPALYGGGLLILLGVIFLFQNTTGFRLNN